ncbi:hypothetical protein [Caulobacter sp. NIBR1757]|uniref:hypothetical protein n=1 Tax=Caulobacter sp. NIBR1757 TaxID=3016000 RepID=UPI0022F00BA0|nr:hypothetical protein [Caulobacter sp. NIBR1757]WGM39322.1 hypothetical protein AMEJIAPC_02240 [Caulobacter sp. NIBR1757]
MPAQWRVQVWLGEDTAPQACLRNVKITAETEAEALAIAARQAAEEADGETLNDGQEEVFSRTEVASGAVEHGSTAGDSKA